MRPAPLEAPACRRRRSVFQQVNAAFSKGPLRVDALAGDNRTAVDQGTLQVIDNQMDQTTGTIRMKAEFPNTNLQLWPGQFINIRLLVDTLKQVVVVPRPACFYRAEFGERITTTKTAGFAPGIYRRFLLPGSHWAM